MNSSALRLLCLVPVVCMCMAAGCKKESSTPTSQAPAGNSSGSGTLTIEYEALPSILFEAESGAVAAPVALYEDAAASGGKYALAPEGPEHKEISIGGDVTYVLTVAEPGDYVLWLRAKWCCSCANSLGITVDGKNMGAIEDAVYEKWHWVRLARKTLAMTEGEHTLTIINREDGAAWDQVLLTQDPEYRPMEIETAEAKGRTVLTSLKPPAPPAETPKTETPTEPAKPQT